MPRPESLARDPALRKSKCPRATFYSGNARKPYVIYASSPACLALSSIETPVKFSPHVSFQASGIAAEPRRSARNTLDMPSTFRSVWRLVAMKSFCDFVKSLLLLSMRLVTMRRCSCRRAVENAWTLLCWRCTGKHCIRDGADTIIAWNEPCTTETAR